MFVDRGQYQCFKICPGHAPGWPQIRALLISLMITFVTQIIKTAVLMARPPSLAGPALIRPPSLQADMAKAQKLASNNLTVNGVPTLGEQGLVNWPALLKNNAQP